MIICCPGCEKRYDIAQYIIAQKEHYKLRCSHCRTLWQLSVPPEPKVITPSSSPAIPASKVTTKPKLPPQEPKKPVPSPKTYNAWHDFIKQYSLDWIILLVAVALVVLLVVYEGRYIRELIRTHFLVTAPQPLSTDATPATKEARDMAPGVELRIEKVVFSMVEQEGQLRFIVKGEVVNPSHMAVTSPDLQIIARGDCSPDLEETNAAETSYPSFPTRSQPQRCILAQWVHPMEGQLVPAGERQSFQAFAPTQGVIKAKEVEITGYIPPQQRRS